MGCYFFTSFGYAKKYRLYSNRNAADMKNVYCLAFHPLGLACLNINIITTKITAKYLGAS